jgi:pyruvate dehydrogenase E2 component (dihydrolipoamide acetyltransferase)
MAQPIMMSSQGMYTAEGKLIGWLRPAGARVEAGEALAEVETEKTIYEVEAATSGILHPVVQPGTSLPLETVIGYLLAEGEAPPIQSNPGALEPAAGSAADSVAQAQKRPVDGRVASPIAKRLARQHSVDLTQIVGTGPGGRIVEADVIKAIAKHGTPDK